MAEKTVSTQQNGFEELMKLKPGSRYTIAYPNDFGLGVQAVRFTMVEATSMLYAQYQTSVFLKIKPQRSRREVGLRFYGEKTFAVWKGWVGIDTNPFDDASVDGGMICRRSRYLSHDPRYLTDAISSVPASPLFFKTK